MYEKFIFLLLIISITIESKRNEISIGSTEQAKCTGSNELGKFNFNIKFTASSEFTKTSYFLMFFKNKQEQKRPSICKIVGTDEEAGEEEKPSEEEEKPSGEEEKSSGEEEKPSGEEEKPSGEEEKPSGEEEKPSGEEEKPSGEEEKPSGEEEKPSEEEEKPSEEEKNATDTSDEALKILLVDLREKLEKRLGKQVENVDTLHKVRIDLELILSFNFITQLKELSLKIKEMENQMNKFGEEKILIPFNAAITKVINQAVEFNMTVLKNDLNETACQIKLGIIAALDKTEELAEKLKDLPEIMEAKEEEIKEILKDFKEKSEEKWEELKESQLYQKVEEFIKELPNKIKESDEFQKILEILEKIKSVAQIKEDSQIIQKIDEFLTKIKIEVTNRMVEKLDLTLSESINKIIAQLLAIQGLVEKIKDIKEKIQNGDITAEQAFSEIKTKITSKLEEIYNQLKEKEEFQNLLLKLEGVDEQIKEKLNSLKDDLKDSLYSLDDKIQEKIDEIGIAEKLKVFIMQLQHMDKEQLKQLLSSLPQQIKNFDKEKIKQQIIDLFKSDQMISKLKEMFNQADSENSELLQKIKASIEQLNDYLKDKLKPIVDYLEPRVMEKLEAAGVPTAFKNYVQNLKDLQIYLDGLKDKQLDEVKLKFNEAVAKIKNINAEDLKNMFANLPNSLKIQTAFEKIKEDWKLLKEYLNSLKLDEKLGNKKEKLIELLKQLDKDILKILQENEIINSLKSKISKEIDEKKLLIENSGIKDKFNSFMNDLNDLKDNCIAFLRSTDSKIADKINEIVERIKKFDISELTGKLSNLGQSQKAKIEQLYKSGITVGQLFELLKDKYSNLKSMSKEEKEKLIDFIVKYENLVKNNKYIQEFEAYIKECELIIKIEQNAKDILQLIKGDLESTGVINALKDSSQSFKILINTLNPINGNEEKIEKKIAEIYTLFKDVSIQDLVERMKQIPDFMQSDKLDQLSKLDFTDTNILDTLKEELNLDIKEEHLPLIQELLPKLISLKSQLSKLTAYLQQKGIIQAFSDYLKSLNTLFDSFKELNALEIKNLKQAVDTIADKFKNFDIEEIKGKLSNLPTLSKDAAEKLQKLIESKVDFDKLKQQLENIDPNAVSSEAKKIITDLLAKIKEETNDLLVEYPQIGQTIEQLKGKFNQYKSELKGKLEQNSVTEAFENFVVSLQNLYKSLEDLKDEKAKKVNEAINAKIEALKTKDFNQTIDTLFNLKLLGGKISKDFNNLRAKIQPTYEQLRNKISQIDFETMAKNQKEEIKKLIEGLIEQSKEFISAHPEIAKNIEEIKGIKDKIKNSDAYKKLTEHFTIVGELIQSYENLYINDFNALKSSFESIKERLSKLNDLKFNGTEYILKLNDTLFDGKDELLKSIEKLGQKEVKIENIKAVLEENIQKLKSINTDKIKDFAESLKDKSFTDIIKEIFASLLDLEDKDDLKNLDIPSILTAIQSKTTNQPKLKEIFEYLQEKTEGNEKLANVLEQIKDANIKVSDKLKGLNEVIAQKLNDFDLEKLKDSLPNLDLKDGELISKLKGLVEKEIEENPQLKEKLKEITDKINEIKEKNSEKYEDAKEAITKKLKEANATIFKNLENAGIIEKFEEYSKKIEELKEKAENLKIDEKVKEFEDKLLEMKDKLANMDLKQLMDKFKESLNNCDNEMIEKIFDMENINANIDKIKTTFLDKKASLEEQKEKIKAAFLDQKALLEEQKEKIKDALNSLKEKIEKLKEDPKFTEKMDKLKQFYESISEAEQIQSLKENWDKFAKLFPLMKESLEGLKENVNRIQFDQALEKIKQKIKDFDFKDSLIKLNSTKDEFLEEMKKFQEIETKGEKLKALLNINIKMDDKINEKIKEVADTIKEKIKSLNKPELDKIIENLEKLNAGITEKIDKEKIRKDLSDYFTKIGELEIKLNNFPDKDSSEENEKAKEEIKELLDKEKLMPKVNEYISDQTQILNDTMNILKIIALKYKELPANADPNELNKNITEILTEEYNALKSSSEKILENTLLEEYMKKAVEKGKKIYKEEIKEAIDSIKENVADIGEKIKALKEEYKDKSMKDIVAEMKEKMKEFDEKNNKFLESQPEIVQKIYDKLKTSVVSLADKIDIGKLEKIKEELEKANADVKDKLQIDKIKADLNKYIQKAKTIKENLEKLSESNDFKSLNANLINLKAVVKDIDFLELLNLFKAINDAKIDVQKEIDNIKRLKELSEEMESIYKSSALLQGAKSVLPGILNKFSKRKLSVSKKKSQKSKVKKIRRRADVQDQLSCRMDEDLSQQESISQDATNLNIYVLKEQSTYSIQIQKTLTLTLPKGNTCNNEYMEEIKKERNIIYNDHTNIIKEKANKRIFFKFYVKFQRTFYLRRPSFFYIKLRITFKRTNKNLLRGLDDQEDDAYCIIDDDSDQDNVCLNCFSFPEDLDEIEDIENISSPIVSDLPSKTSETSEPSNQGNVATTTPVIPPEQNGTNDESIYFRKGNSSSLSAGAIVGIILACIVALAIIISLIICLKKRATPTAPSEENNISDSHNNFQISNSINKPPKI